jgi:2-dehydro-3-deoxyphosphooctonate aldolase (KDO 8-P synthase)
MFPELNVVFKGSFDKANKTSIYANRKLGLKAGLGLLGEVKTRHGLPVTIDIHLLEQEAPVAEICNIL